MFHIYIGYIQVILHDDSCALKRYSWVYLFRLDGHAYKQCMSIYLHVLMCMMMHFGCRFCRGKSLFLCMCIFKHAILKFVHVCVWREWFTNIYDVYKYIRWCVYSVMQSINESSISVYVYDTACTSGLYISTSQSVYMREPYVYGLYTSISTYEYVYMCTCMVDIKWNVFLFRCQQVHLSSYD